MDVTQNLEGTNDCDEANTGDNNAQCSNNISNNIDSITQTNTIDPLAGTQFMISPTSLPLPKTWWQQMTVMKQVLEITMQFAVLLQVTI